ncbi:unnamed protein product [Spirodela intermedia]|uniref:Uncharacterized protein n=1 Tax=Spirodela intermedia TaxID=51605 RepID=A0A7I8LDQ4_SPIIN|nr:unnamed protein product [Spirodela intermedia]
MKQTRATAIRSVITPRWRFTFPLPPPPPPPPRLPPPIPSTAWSSTPSLPPPPPPPLPPLLGRALQVLEPCNCFSSAPSAAS